MARECSLENPTRAGAREAFVGGRTQHPGASLQIDDLRAWAIHPSRSADNIPLADTEIALSREFADQWRSRRPGPGPPAGRSG
jgi:hypothetical protein